MRTARSAPPPPDDTAIATEPGATTRAGAAAVDLTDVRFDVRRDPG